MSDVHLKPSARFMLDVLKSRPGEWVSALDFKQGRFGEHIDACSQRFRELVVAGLPVISTGRHGHAVAQYKYIGTPSRTVPDVTTFGGALFDTDSGHTAAPVVGHV